MSKFTVMYKSTNSMYLNVEADSLEEAKETAENTDGGEFINAGSGDWEYAKLLTHMKMKLTQIIVAIMKHDEVIISERKNYARKKCARNQSYKRKYLLR